LQQTDIEMMMSRDNSKWVRHFSSMSILFCFILGSGASWFGILLGFSVLFLFFILGCLIVVLCRKAIGFGFLSEIVTFGLTGAIIYVVFFWLSFGRLIERDYGSVRVNGGTLRMSGGLLVDDGTVTRIGYFWAAQILIPVLIACWLSTRRSRNG
jgi:hypothetical protein